jgi:FecR protein
MYEPRKSARNALRAAAVTVACLAAIGSLPTAVEAAQNIGKAVSVVPQVSGRTGGRAATLGAGDGVQQDEVIQTAASGTAQLRFIDATSLSIGPSATVTLDSFVFNPGGSAKSFVLDAGKGAFRFVTGNSNHDAYEIRTPAAVIGVRGTQFSFVVTGTRLSLTVFQGRVIVCPRGLPRSSCQEVAPSQTIAAETGRPVVFVSGGGARPQPPRRPPPRSPKPPRTYTPPTDYDPPDNEEPPPRYYPRPPYGVFPLPGFFPRPYWPHPRPYWPRPPRGDGYPPRGEGPYGPRPHRHPPYGRGDGGGYRRPVGSPRGGGLLR